MTPILKPLEPFREPDGRRQRADRADRRCRTAATPWRRRRSSPATSSRSRPRARHPAPAITLDQVIARQIGQDTLLPSLEVATEDFSTSIGALRHRLQLHLHEHHLLGRRRRRRCRWRPIRASVFERMFGGAGTPEQRRGAACRRTAASSTRSPATAKRLQSGLGARDRDQARPSTSTTSARSSAASRRPSSRPRPIRSTSTAPVGPPELYDEHVAVMFDLMAAAFQADITRVFTFMLTRDVSQPRRSRRSACPIRITRCRTTPTAAATIRTSWSSSRR